MQRVAFSVSIVAGLLLSLFFITVAWGIVGSSGGGPHATCMAWVAMPPPKPPPPFCSEPSPKGPVPGRCAWVLCKATGAPGLDGGNVLDSALQALQGLLQQLMQKQGGGGGGGESGAAQGTSQLYPNCTTSPLTGGLVTVPCTDSTGAIITTSSSPSTLFTTGSLGDTSTVLGTLYGDSASPSSLSELASQSGDVLVSSQGSGASVQTGTTPASVTPQQVQSAPYEPPPPALPGSQVFISGGSGDVLVQDGVATVVARVREATSESAGFFGGTPAPSLCSARPWAVATGIISPAF